MRPNISTNLAKAFRLPGITAGMLICAFISFCSVNTNAQGVRSRAGSKTPVVTIPKRLMLRIVRAEDERRWDTDLGSLLSDQNPSVRARAALAAGRIGDERAVPALVSLLQQDKDEGVRAMAAFALGETESAMAEDALLAQLVPMRGSGKLTARIMEALGKIAAALPRTDEARAHSSGAAILGMLNFEHEFRTNPDRQIVLLGLTAALRARPEGAGKVIAQFLSSADPRVRADAANALARLRAKDGNEQLRKLVSSDPDPVVRANAARVLGVTEDKAALDSLLQRALKDTDSRVRVSAVRALASLKDARAAEKFLKGSANWDLQSLRTESGEGNEVLEIATTLGRLLQGTEDKEALVWLGKARESFNYAAPEVEIAFVRVSPSAYLAHLGSGSDAKRKAQEWVLLNWKAASSIAQGLGEIAGLTDSTKDKGLFAGQAQDILRAMLDYKNPGIVINTLVAVHSEYAIPDVLRALAAFKPKDMGEVGRKHLNESDVVIRATAAEVLGELPPDEANTRALTEALPVALKEKESNDAALAILDSLAKQKTPKANEAIKNALDSSDHLTRRKTVASLKANGAGDFSSRIGTVETRHTAADYERALSRIDKTVRAVLTTSKGAFTIELLANEAPLNVDNYVQLAKRGYFNGISFHRVVPNFVIQDGDPRGDGNGGPGYQIRCEINEVPYDRGAVGMALSGKDTGGSQWFVTHSPQPHLDGGYTVFGRVIAGMNVVDRITRGDVIRSIVITEEKHRSPRPRT